MDGRNAFRLALLAIPLNSRPFMAAKSLDDDVETSLLTGLAL